MTKEKKQKIKEKAKKIVNIVCYILSICFIGLMILTGLQSCKTTESNSAETYNPELQYRYVYTPYFENNPTIMSGAAFLQWSYENLNGYQPSDNPASFDRYCFTNNTYLQVIIGDNIYGANNIRLHYERLDNVGVIPAPYGLVEVSLVRYTTSNYYKVSDLYVAVIVTSGVQLNHGDFKVYCNVDNASYPYLFVTDELDNSRRFVFNKVFNYNAPEDLNLGVDYYTPDNVNHTSNNGWTYGGTSTRGNLTYNRYYINTPSFVTNEQVFNRIVWEVQLDTNSALGFTHDNGLTAVWAPEDSSCYYGLYYVNTETNTEVLVNYRNQLIVYDNVYNLPALCYTNDTTWTNDNYRYVIFVESLTTAQYNTISPFNNNVQYGGFSSGSETTIFTLLAQAFSCVGSVLNITILPYMTIGMLLFLPLVVTIIVVIVHLLKK